MRHTNKQGTTKTTGVFMARDLRAFFPKTKTVVDATAPRVIEVDEGDIMLGDPKRPYACATARSLMRTNPGAIPVVSEHYTYLIDTRTGIATRFANTLPLRKQIRSYDANGTMAPGEYTLGVVAHAHAIGTSHHAAVALREPRTPGVRRRREVVRGWSELMEAAKALRAKVAPR